MRKINLMSLVEAKNSLTEDAFESFKGYHEIKIKADEINVLEQFILFLDQRANSNYLLDEFFVGYSIPQIGKEFDLLRFGVDSLINIELKSSSSEEKILTQLLRNKYYLNFVDKEVLYFTFVAATNSLFHLGEGDQLVGVESELLTDLLSGQDIEDVENINKLFNPSDYLVSPFNSTDRFLLDEYFLTLQQEDVQRQIFQHIDESMSTSFISLTGGAGTGKTLLAYDTAKKAISNGTNTLILHCGQLNEGHGTLLEMGWIIKPIKECWTCDFSEARFIVVDEAQRLYPKQIEHICNAAFKNEAACMFAYDRQQTLAQGEEKADLDANIKELDSAISFNLSEKIRSNKEIADFIKQLFQKKKNFAMAECKNIVLRYFSNLNSAVQFLKSVNEENWTVLRFTPSRYDKEYHEQFFKTLG